MGWVTGIAVYAIIWWLTFFMILPIGAPVHSHIGRKLIINTLLATAVFAAVFLADYYDVISFRDFRTPSSGRAF